MHTLRNLIYFYCCHLIFLFKAHGHYIYLEATDVQKGATSKLTSNSINSVDDVCLTFWYHMHGQSMGTLNVYTESGNITRRYWSKSGNQGNSWNFASFDISSSEPYTITFEGVCGGFYTSDIALDDIFMRQRSCSGKSIIISTTTSINISILYKSLHLFLPTSLIVLR